MIKVNEIRKGILLAFYKPMMQEPQHLTVTGFYKNDADGLWYVQSDEYADINEAGLIGIPITTEWLERCGFVIDNKLARNHEQEIHYSYRNNQLEFTFTVAYVKDLTGADVTRVRIRLDGDILYTPKAVVYLHQLQNLYFALTGEELKLKDQ